MKSTLNKKYSSSSIIKILFVSILLFPYLEVLFWEQRQLIHILVYSFILILLLFNLYQNVLYFGIKSFLALGFLLYLLALVFYNTVNSQTIHRSTWSLFIIAAFFANMQYRIYARYSISDSEIAWFRALLLLTLAGHILLIVFSNSNYEKLSVTEINPIPLLSISLAIGIYRKDKMLSLFAILTTCFSFSFSLQLSTILVFLSIPITEILTRFKPKYLLGLIAAGSLSYLFAFKSLLKLLLNYSLNFTSDNVQIRIQMNNFAQSVIDQNPLVGGHLAAPLSLAISRGANTSQLPFHSDIMTLLVACGALGLFLYLSNIITFFYKEPIDSSHRIFLKVAKVGLISSLLTGVVNPVFPGYILLFCFALCLI
jgi:hypothetical protein